MAYGYCIGHITVDDAAAYQDYAEKDPATIAAYGGEYLVRGGRSEVMEGTFPGSRTVVIRFPSLAAAKDWGALMLVEGV
jgi:uncharacterized protein (DUF1330 family)